MPSKFYVIILKVQMSSSEYKHGASLKLCDEFFPPICLCKFTLCDMLDMERLHGPNIFIGQWEGAPNGLLVATKSFVTNLRL